VIALASGRAWINPTGGPALATAGTGDALAGMLGALLAQGYEWLPATLAAVWLHGRAGEGIEAGLVAGAVAPRAAALLSELRAAG
jgi:NAD(P)H-hydrate repair Nnr-like enzyme with NAD(P)H-hydrate dehydratase domain